MSDKLKICEKYAVGQVQSRSYNTELQKLKNLFLFRDDVQMVPPNPVCALIAYVQTQDNNIYNFHGLVSNCN